MKVVIVGCGRVGATIAEVMDREGHDVTILDVATSAFDRLPETFRGNAIRGDGTDEDVLRRAGAEQADLFLALTEGDNRNVMAAQLALDDLARAELAGLAEPGRRAALAGLAASLLVALLFYGMPLSIAVSSALYGAAFDRPIS